jgi:hydrogenase expression/formation protein HypE
VRITLSEQAIPVRDPVVSVCQMLGYDPLLLACEGRVVAVVAQQDASEVLGRWRSLPAGEQAALIGRVEAGNPLLVLETELGGRRVLEELEDDPLPRIC